MSLTRRSFLGKAAAAGAGLAGVAPARAGAQTRGQTKGRVTHERHRVVVIGSGFGGGVSALRLAQAGVPVTVLERGIWWPTGPNAETFPHGGSPDKRALWYGSAPQLLGRPLSVAPYAGLLETVVGENITAVVAAGVGGGSLVYQGMTLQPTEEVFAAHFPERLDYRRLNAIYYPRVARMLQIETAPDALINSPTYFAARVFARNVERAGYRLSKIPMPIDWSFALDELAGKMQPSYTNGDCALGVNNGGKHSVDVTYLKQALATGRVTVNTLHNVTSVVRAHGGRWQVHVDRTDTTGKVLEKKVLTTDALIMAAGTVNTTKLLLKAAQRGQIPDMPDALGRGFGSNGDQIYMWTDLTDDLGAVQGGPVVYGSFEWDDPKMANTIIQASLPPVGVDTHSTTVVGYGVSPTRGQITYNPASDSAELRWPVGGDSAIDKRINERITAIAGPASALINTNDAENTTWHSLGGASMGKVCDLEGRVHGHRGLYVIDGALMPGTTCACNPSMTIAAVAERALDQIVRHDVGTII